jgi:hypothetical protein
LHTKRSMGRVRRRNYPVPTATSGRLPGQPPPDPFRTGRLDLLVSSPSLILPSLTHSSEDAAPRIPPRPGLTVRGGRAEPLVPTASPLHPDTRWFHRGTVFIDLDSGAGRFEEASGTGGAVVLLGDEGEWYQVGLETGGDGIGPMSSTRAVSDDICSGLPGRLQSEYPNCLSVTASGLLLLLLVPVLVVVLVPVPVLAILSTMWLCRFPIAFALGL